MLGALAPFLPYLTMVGIGAGGLLYLSKDKISLAEHSAFLASAIVFTILAILVIKTDTLYLKEGLMVAMLIVPLVVYYIIYKRIAETEESADFKGKTINEILQEREEVRKWLVALVILVGIALMGILKVRRG